LTDKNPIFSAASIKEALISSLRVEKSRSEIFGIEEVVEEVVEVERDMF